MTVRRVRRSLDHTDADPVTRTPEVGGQGSTHRQQQHPHVEVDDVGRGTRHAEAGLFTNSLITCNR